jgi:hypothetical protein
LQFAQHQRSVKHKVDDKKVRLEYSKITVLVEKVAHGRGNAGSLTEEWVTVSAKGGAVQV